MSIITTVGTAVSFTATASLAMIGWVPVIGLLVWPLQLAAWVIRGWLFQYISLTALASYQARYRRFSEPRRPAISIEARTSPA